MRIEYWICDGEWKKVGCDEYYAYKGTKIIATGMGLGWALTMRIFRNSGCIV